MTQLQLLTTWGQWAAGAAFWGCLLWPGITAVFWRWWRTEWGWNMAIKTEMIALALLGSVLHKEFGVPFGYPLMWTGVLSVSLIPPVIIWRLVIIWRAQRDGARDDKDPGAAPLKAPQELPDRMPPPEGGGYWRLCRS